MLIRQAIALLFSALMFTIPTGLAHGLGHLAVDHHGHATPCQHQTPAAPPHGESLPNQDGAFGQDGHHHDHCCASIVIPKPSLDGAGLVWWAPAAGCWAEAPSALREYASPVFQPPKLLPALPAIFIV
jgi:hypothetical protein